MSRAPDLRDVVPSMQAPASAAPANSDAPTISARTRRVLPIDLSAIRVNKRLRKIDREALAGLASSMADIGQQQPVSLRADPDDPAMFILVAGAHRFEAARSLGWPQLEALIVDAPDDEHRLIEIDENLMRADLTVLDRARFLCERKKIFLTLHPERRRGGDRSSQHYAETRNDHPTGHASWAEETSERVALSPRTVQRSVTIGEGIPDELADALADTRIAEREGDLYRLSKMDAEHQAEALDALRSADRPPATLASLLGPARPDRPQGSLDRLKRSWFATPPDVQNQFLSWLRDTGSLEPHPDR